MIKGYTQIGDKLISEADLILHEGAKGMVRACSLTYPDTEPPTHRIKAPCNGFTDRETCHDYKIRLQKHQLHEMNSRQEIISGYISVVARGTGLGAVLFVMLTADAGRNMQFNFISYSIAVSWSYFDGPFSQRRWSVA